MSAIWLKNYQFLPKIGLESGAHQMPWHWHGHFWSQKVLKIRKHCIEMMAPWTLHCTILLKNYFCNESQQFQNFSCHDSASETQTPGLPTAWIMSQDLHHLPGKTNAILTNCGECANVCKQCFRSKQVCAIICCCTKQVLCNSNLYGVLL